MNQLRLVPRYAHEFNYASCYDGCCPDCVEWKPQMLNIERDHWGCCDKHRVKWHIGSNLYSSWQYENRLDWLRNERHLAPYRNISGTHHGCFAKSPARQPDELLDDLSS